MLELVSFICGASVMVMEMAGSRLLAPHLGTSIVVWTAIISVIMASLSLGYWLGGKLADKNPNAATLAGIILSAAAFVLMAAFLQENLLPQLTGMRLETAAIFAAAALFSVPGILLGMVSPYIIQVKLAQIRSKDKSGSIIGRFYAISTIGSILGTFLGGYYLISWLGTRTILYAVAAVLALAAALAAPYRRRVPALLVLALALSAVYLTGGGYAEDPVRGFSTDTRYNHLQVGQGNIAGYPGTLRFLITDPGSIQSAMYVNSPYALALGYSKFYQVAWHTNPEAGNFLMLGGGGFSVPKYLIQSGKDVRVDVVEIDPGITRVAREHFALQDDPRLRVFDEDARVFLNRTAAKVLAGEWASPEFARYDVIMGDTFTSSYNIPFHLGTVECAERIYALLEEDGVFACNIISALNGEAGQVFRSIYHAFAEVFPQLHVFPVSYPGNAGMVQNIMLLALKKPGPLPLSWDQDLRAMLDVEWQNPIPADVPPLRDDYGPVERYALAILRERQRR